MKYILYLRQPILQIPTFGPDLASWADFKLHQKYGITQCLDLVHHRVCKIKIQNPNFILDTRRWTSPKSGWFQIW
jgi:hypothetical protein